MHTGGSSMGAFRGNVPPSVLEVLRVNKRVCITYLDIWGGGLEQLHHKGFPKPEAMPWYFSARRCSYASGEGAVKHLPGADRQTTDLRVGS